MSSTKKIKFDQVDSNFIKTAELLRCSFNTTHLVEDPIVCQKPTCQQILCKSCYLFWGTCKVCGSIINIEQASAAPSVKNLLNKIYKCENFKNGCLVEIDYENYRNHTKNCKFKQLKIMTDEEKQKMKTNQIGIPSPLIFSKPTMPLFQTSFHEKHNIYLDFKDFKYDDNLLQNNDSRSRSLGNVGFKTQSEMITDQQLLTLQNLDYNLFTIKSLKSILNKRRIAKTGNKA